MSMVVRLSEHLLYGRYDEHCETMQTSQCFCSYVGKRRLDKALELNKERANFRIQWWGTADMSFHLHASHDGLLSSQA